MEGAGSVRRNSSWRRENQTSGSDCSKKRNQEGGYGEKRGERERNERREGGMRGRVERG